MENNIIPQGAHQTNPHIDAQSHLENDTPKGQANNLYELTSISQGIKWMHAVCGYPVKSTFIKAIRARKYAGWPALSIENVYKHYPKTEETPKGHRNQS